MLTIFTIPKPFIDPHIRIIQRNALQSWKKIGADVEIFLIGNDEGVRETAEEFGLIHIPDVRVNEFGTPLLDSAFDLARKRARFNTIMYVNADIIFTKNFSDALPKLPKESSLTIGRRTDLDIKNEINFNDSLWEEKLLKEIENSGKIHSYAGIDYFIFNKNSFGNLPPFSVGRIGWDNWTVRESRKSLKYTIDATNIITAIHENHGYSGNNTGSMRKTNPEALKNSSYIKTRGGAFTIEDANWKLTKEGMKRNYLCFIPFVKRWLKSFL